MLKYAILSVSLITVMAGAMIAPAVASIAAAFPDATALQINVLTSLHAGMVVPFSFISGYLVRKYSKKNILIVSLILYLIAGLGGAVSPNIWFMLATRALLGISVGLMIPISLTLITDNYHGEERTQTLGLQSAATNLGGIIAIMVSGFLALYGWQFSFMAYGMAAPILILVLLILPNKAPQPYVKDSANNKFDPRIFLLAIYMVMTFVVFFGIPSNMALFLEELDVTNTVVNGIIIATCSVGGFLGGLSLAFFRRKFKTFFVPLQVTFMAIGFSLIVFYDQSLIAMGIGVLILGFGYGSTVPVIFDSASKISTGNAMAMATALLVSSIYLGQFISPVLLGTVSRLFGDGSVHFSYLMMALALIFVAVMLMINKFLHITGIKHWLTRNSSKRLFAEISSQQSDLQMSVEKLNTRLDQMQNAETDRNMQQLMEMVEKLHQKIEMQNKQQPQN
ncbi:MAG: MFS transporter [Methylophaga sp.]